MFDPLSYLMGSKAAGGGGGGGGGGGSSVEEKDVNFIDYDGTILYSYTAEEFAALTEMPANPDHTDIGLTAQGWNWTLADAKECVKESDACDIGQTYVTTSGKTEIYIDLMEDALSPYLAIIAKGTVTIDWGDGSPTETHTGTSLDAIATLKNHTYAAAGEYKISLWVENPNHEYALSGVTYRMLLCSNSSTTENNLNYACAVKKIFVGDHVKFGTTPFQGLKLLEILTLPLGVKGSVSGCQSQFLKSVIFPSNYETGAYSNLACSRVSVSNGRTGINISSNGKLKKIILPQSTTTIAAQGLASESVRKIIIPSKVTEIQNYAFNSMKQMQTLVMRPTTPPTLGTGVFSGTNPALVIYVPYSADHSVLNSYKTASGWSDYASQIVELPE